MLLGRRGAEAQRRVVDSLPIRVNLVFIRLKEKRVPPLNTKYLENRGNRNIITGTGTDGINTRFPGSLYVRGKKNKKNINYFCNNDT